MEQEGEGPQGWRGPARVSWGRWLLLTKDDVPTCDSHHAEKGSSILNNSKSQESVVVSKIRIMAELFLYSVS